MTYELNSYDGNLEEKLRQIVVGNSVTEVVDNRITLSSGTVLVIEKETRDCCSYLQLAGVFRTGDSIITDLKIEDTDSGANGYQATIFVVTASGPGVLAVAVGDASNGYYLHGWSLDVTVEGNDEAADFWKELGL